MGVGWDEPGGSVGVEQVGKGVGVPVAVAVGWRIIGEVGVGELATVVIPQPTESELNSILRAKSKLPTVMWLLELRCCPGDIRYSSSNVSVRTQGSIVIYLILAQSSGNLFPTEKGLPK